LLKAQSKKKKFFGRRLQRTGLGGFAPVDFVNRFVSVRLAMAKNPFSRLVKILTGISTGAESEFNRLERFAHFCVLVGKSFVRNRCPVRAAALSYATLLALIPMLAVAISVTSSILKDQGEKEIYSAIDKLVSSIMPPATAKSDGHGVSLDLSPISITLTPTNSVVAKAQSGFDTNTNIIAGATENSVNDAPVVSVSAQKEAAKSIHEFIQNTQSSSLGLVGMLVLVFIAIRMLANIEETFNDIWGVTRGRTWLSRIILYWATLTLGPLLLAGALALASSPHFQATKGIVGGTVIGSFIFELLPLVVLWLAFALAYQLVPHTKIHFGAALVGGIVGGTLWHLNSVFGFLYVSRVVSNSKIYGSLGLVPVFMAGLYFSWLILLFGAQVAYAFQNRQAYLQDKLLENVSQRGREFIALRLMTCVGQRFQLGEPPVTLSKISTELGIPTRLAQQVLLPLLAARIVVEIGGNEPGYTPARPLDAITAHDILHALRTGGQELPMREDSVRAEVLGEFARIEAAERAAASTITLLALVHRTQAQLELTAPKANEE
jgi:membrane protein